MPEMLFLCYSYHKTFAYMQKDLLALNFNHNNPHVNYRIDSLSATTQRNVSHVSVREPLNMCIKLRKKSRVESFLSHTNNVH